MKRLVLSFVLADDGATALEYGLIVALLSGVVILAMTATGNNMSALFGYIGDTFSRAVGSGASGNTAS